MRKQPAILILLGFVVVFAPFVSMSTVKAQVVSLPPAPRFAMTLPKINEITYMIDVTNSGLFQSSVSLDVALPKTWTPDTYVEIKEIKGTGVSFETYSSRENSYANAVFDLNPHESVQVNVTFYSLRYKLEYYTHGSVQGVSYPNQLAVYTQPEAYIESNDSVIESLATALVADRKNPFRIAEKMYDFVISQLKYEAQSEARGALWALLNRRGDCTEYGTLFVALMRAVGIPARTVTGHMTNALSQGGVANATIWADSPHLWAEFYVEGYGWIPVDPTSGENDPLDHFSVGWPIYLPFLKGPEMESPTRALLTLRAQNVESVSYTATLLITPLASLPFQNQAFVSIYEANEVVCMMNRTAAKAIELGFNIANTYPLLQEAYDAFYSATQIVSNGDDVTTSIYAKAASQKAAQALASISTSIKDEAHTSISRAWLELRVLGALSGENYMRGFEGYESNGDYAGVVKCGYLARMAADQAPNILLFLGPVLLCVLAVLMVTRKVAKGRLL